MSLPSHKELSAGEFHGLKCLPDPDSKPTEALEPEGLEAENLRLKAENESLRQDRETLKKTLEILVEMS